MKTLTQFVRALFSRPNDLSKAPSPNGHPRCASRKEPTCQCRRPKRHGFKGHSNHSSIFAWRIPMDKGAWRATVHGVTKRWTQLSDFSFTFHSHALEKEMATHSTVFAWRIPMDRGAWWATVQGVAKSQT